MALRESTRSEKRVVLSWSERVPADQLMAVLDALTVTTSVESTSVKERVPAAEESVESR